MQDPFSESSASQLSYSALSGLTMISTTAEIASLYSIQEGYVEKIALFPGSLLKKGEEKPGNIHRKRCPFPVSGLSGVASIYECCSLT